MQNMSDKKHDYAIWADTYGCRSLDSPPLTNLLTPFSGLFETQNQESGANFQWHASKAHRFNFLSSIFCHARQPDAITSNRGEKEDPDP
jgi:hypothetical protein